MIIGFSTTDKIFSKIVRTLTNSAASHSFVQFECASEPLVLHANGHGVNIMHYNRFIKKKINIVAKYDVNISKDDEHKLLSYMLWRLGQPYDRLAIVGFLWVILNRVFGRKVRNPFRNKSAYFCSELLVGALRAANFPGSYKLGMEKTSPDDLMKFIEKSGASKL